MYIFLYKVTKFNIFIERLTQYLILLQSPDKYRESNSECLIYRRINELGKWHKSFFGQQLLSRKEVENTFNIFN